MYNREFVKRGVEGNYSHSLHLYATEDENIIYVRTDELSETVSFEDAEGNVLGYIDGDFDQLALESYVETVYQEDKYMYLIWLANSNIGLSEDIKYRAKSAANQMYLEWAAKNSDETFFDKTTMFNVAEKACDLLPEKLIMPAKKVLAGVLATLGLLK